MISTQRIPGKPMKMKLAQKKNHTLLYISSEKKRVPPAAPSNEPMFSFRFGSENPISLPTIFTITIFSSIISYSVSKKFD